MLNSLFKHTQLQDSFGIILLALVNGEPHVLNLKRMLNLFLEHRRDVVTRRTKYELRKAEERAHILEGLKIALDNLDEVIELIKASKSPEDARNSLIERFELSEIQAQAILDMKLQRLTGLERDKILAEHKEIVKLIKKLKGILASGKLVNDIIREELEEIKEKYADKRRTKITGDAKEITIEDMITEEEMVITISHGGYIKRNALSDYRSQRRGGKGLTGMGTREEDFVESLFIASTHDHMLFFTNKGRLHWKKTFEIPEVGRTARGRALANLLMLTEGEKLATCIPVRDFEKGYLVMFTKQGNVKKTELKEYSHPRAKGIYAISIKDGDELIAVRLTDGTKDLIMGTIKGQAIRFNEEDVRSMGRTAAGVRGIKLKKDDEVVSADVVEEKTTLLTVTQRGMGKRTKVGDYRLQTRGGQGVISIKLTPKGGDAVGLIQVRDEDEVVIISNKGKLIRTKAKDISTLGRATQGVRLMDVNGEEQVTSIGRVADRAKATGGEQQALIEEE